MKNNWAVTASPRLEPTFPRRRHRDLQYSAAPRGSGATEAAAREDVRRVAESLRAPHEDFNGEAFLIVPG
jgi:hypothetical protein